MAPAELAAAYPVLVFEREQGVERRAKALLLLLILEGIPHRLRWPLPSVAIVASAYPGRGTATLGDGGARRAGKGCWCWGLGFELALTSVFEDETEGELLSAFLFADPAFIFEGLSIVIVRVGVDSEGAHAYAADSAVAGCGGERVGWREVGDQVVVMAGERQACVSRHDSSGDR